MTAPITRTDKLAAIEFELGTGSARALTVAEMERHMAALRAIADDYRAAGPVPRPLDEWTEDMGDVLWWRFPVTEPPYVGSPNDLGQVIEIEIRTRPDHRELHTTTVGGWPGYHTHFTPIPMPEASSHG